MKYLLPFLLGLFACQTEAPKDCLAHKEGLYFFENQQATIYVHRTQDRQYEYIPNGDTLSVHRVEWVNDCSYRLILLSGDSATRAFQGEKTLTVTITEASPEQYTFVARMEDMEGGQIKGQLQRKTP
ncbi:MAG: hypothetical protein ACFCUI_08940 [Bernardetiaceae bacterium]